MATVIYKPYRVSQTSTGTQLVWTLTGAHAGCSCGPLRAIALSDGTLTDRSDTGQLEYYQYRTGTAVTGTLTGIELIVYDHQQSRVLDKTVQLKLSNSLIGNNRAQNDTASYNTYGGATDMWGTTLALADINSVSVILQYQSNTTIPHRDTVHVDTAWLRLTYTP